MPAVLALTNLIYHVILTTGLSVPLCRPRADGSPICPPDGQITANRVQPIREKCSACAQSQITSIARRILSRRRGARAIATVVGTGRDGHFDVVRRTTLKRTAKSCGPDAPTLAFKFAKTRVPRLADDGGKKARSPRRARRKPLKPSRGECRRWIQAVVATPIVFTRNSNSSSASAGVFHSSVFLGLVLRAAATADISSAL
jgi:hypothetical protein